MLCLVARYNAEVARWPVPAKEARLGSAIDNDYVVPYPGVSRYHVRLASEDHCVRLIDLNSKNGIVVRGQRVTEALLRAGDIVVIGRASLSLEESRTSDIELALATAVRNRRHEPGDTSAEHEVGGDAAVALRLIRDIEAGGAKFSGRRRRSVLEQVHRVLQSESLTLCSVHRGGDVTVASIAGPMPPDEVLDRGGQLFAAGQKKWRSMASSVGQISCAYIGRVHHFLVATFRVPPEEWASDLLAYVGEKLIGSSCVRDDEKPTTEVVRYGQLVYPAGMVIGPSEPMKRLIHQIAATVCSRLDVLLLGETGTGKELFAKMIHNSGPTQQGRFLAINCAAIPAELLEAELFGVHGRVATGVDPRPGLFAQANGGSILLDEIGELPERLQAKLLRVLQEREILPLGATTPRRIDVRVISASNRNLATLVEEGRFRADLYYRLRGLQFHIPPLRDRKDDIPLLVMEFVTRAASEYGKVIDGVSRHALRLLIEHDWPGNVRELESEIRRSVLVCPTGGILQAEHLGTVRWNVRRQKTPEGVEQGGVSTTQTQVAESRATLRQKIDEIERAQIEDALASTGGNQTRAARMLGITRNGLAMKLRRLAIVQKER